jgi:hypothetical protein
MPINLTSVHTAISVIGILSGAFVLLGLAGNRSPGWMTAVFLGSTILTSVTGFLFPISGITPAVLFGLISLPLLAAAVAALYGFGMRGAWRPIYVITAIVAFYLNAFVGVFQSFQKIGALHALAPTQSEPPFVIAQVVLLIVVIAAAVAALLRFRPISRPA